MEEQWDNLIVLDACRYDFFKLLYKKYFRGILEKIESVGASTPEWCVNTFSNYYDDVVYISANPHINSKTAIWNGSWAAKDHFHKIVNVWLWGWDEELRTVHPKEVNRGFRAAKEKYPEKRFILHYMQPHAPYISHQPKVQFRQPIVNRKDGEPPPFPEKLAKKLLFLGKRANLHTARRFNIHIQKTLLKIYELLGFSPADRMDAVRRELGDKGLKQLYAQNLRIVLQYVASLIHTLSGTTFITADHGEYLGELGDYGHLAKLYDPLLLEVPWFKVEEVKTAGIRKQRIREKIKALKASHEI